MSKKEIEAKAIYEGQEIQLSKKTINSIYKDVIDSLGDSMEELDFEVEVYLSQQIIIESTIISPVMSHFDQTIKKSLNFNPKDTTE